MKTVKILSISLLASQLWILKVDTDIFPARHTVLTSLLVLFHVIFSFTGISHINLDDK